MAGDNPVFGQLCGNPPPLLDRTLGSQITRESRRWVASPLAPCKSHPVASQLLGWLLRWRELLAEKNKNKNADIIRISALQVQDFI